MMHLILGPSSHARSHFNLHVSLFFFCFKEALQNEQFFVIICIDIVINTITNCY